VLVYAGCQIAYFAIEFPDIYGGPVAAKLCRSNRNPVDPIEHVDVIRVGYTRDSYVDEQFASRCR
jgi:hypothetical protein